MSRVLAGIGATAGLVALLVGAPWALSVWGRAGLLSSIDWRHVAGVPDDGRLMLGLLSVAGWAAWLVLAVSVVVEVAESVDRLRAVRRRRPHRPLSLPGLDLPRLLVRGLVVTAVTAVVGIGSPRAATAVVAPVVASVPAYTDPTEGGDPSVKVRAGHVTVAAPHVGAETGPALETKPVTDAPASVIGPQEDERGVTAQYDDDIVFAPRTADSPDMVILEPLEVGSRLVIPSIASADGTRLVVVARGDSLWRLADRYLGDGERWPEIFALNRDVITNPNLIFRGSRLRLPSSAPRAPGGVGAAMTTDVAPRPAHAAAHGALPNDPASVPGGVRRTAASTVPGSAPVPVATVVPSGGAPSDGASPVPTSAVGTPATQAQSVGSAATDQGDDARALSASQALALGVIGTVGAGFAAALVRTVRRRRDVQLALRPPGRRILFPSDSTRVVESALSLVSAPSLPDRLRATPESPSSTVEPGAGGSSPADGEPTTVGREPATVEALPAPTGRGPEPTGDESTPPGVQAGDGEPASLTSVGTGPGHVSHEPRRAIPHTAWATVTAGLTVGGPLDLDLESHGVVVVDLDDPQASWGTACAWALELACGPWSMESHRRGAARIVAAGPTAEALVAAELDSIVSVPTTGAALDDLAATVSRQRQELQASGWSLQRARLDLDARDAWWPTVYVLGALDESSARRVDEALREEPRTAVSVIVVGSGSEGAAGPVLGARLTGSADRALLEPECVRLRPVSLSALGTAGVVELLRTSGSDETEPAPWYATEDAATATGDGPVRTEGAPQVALAPTEDPPAATEEPPVNILQPLPRHAGPMKEAVDVGDDSPGVTDFSHPTLMLLGPIALLGAAGPPPARAERSCIEYCAWMVEHPGATASHMAASLLVAEGTRRSNVSRLRGWLGVSEDGVPYLPEAYTGRLYLDPVVSSDWQRMQALVSPGINRVPVSTLVSALKLVRGAPLADAAPGQWHWAEELRTDMVSMIRDIGARVGDVALADGNLDLARWAASRALVAAPGDEVLMRLRLRTEHRAGNRPEVERIVLHLTRHARVLGIDLDDETVEAIQEAIEGRPRARA